MNRQKWLEKVNVDKDVNVCNGCIFSTSFTTSNFAYF